MELFDTHCHIDMGHHFPDFEEVLANARAAGVTGMVLAGVHRTGWERMFEVCRCYPGLYGAPGLHPMYMDCHGEDDISHLARLVGQGEARAVGEIGLDYHCSVDRFDQQELFQAQLDIAAEADLPVLLHVRKAHDQVLATLRRSRHVCGGIVHAFNGSRQQAEHYIKLGFMISVCGTVTFERSRKIRRVAADLPLECLVLETDSPDIPPVNHYGQRNQPCYLGEILQALADLRGESPGEVARVTTANARKVLRL